MTKGCWFPCQPGHSSASLTTDGMAFARVSIQTYDSSVRIGIIPASPRRIRKTVIIQTPKCYDSLAIELTGGMVPTRARFFVRLLHVGQFVGIDRRGDQRIEK